MLISCDKAANVFLAIANKACPWGPYIPFYTGRLDNATAAPIGQLPFDTSDTTSLIDVFSTRNFTMEDLVALVGAHSCGANLSYAPFDTTPGVMDSPVYYTEVLRGNAPAALLVDKSLAFSPLTSAEWQQYSVDQNAWNIAYIAA